MSGTMNAIHSNVSYALQLHSRALTLLQEQAATGARINRTSDDPSSAHRVLGLNSQQRFLSNYMNTIDNAISAQNMTTSILQSMTSTLSDIRVRLTQILSGTYSEGEGGQSARERIATEVNDVLEEMVSMANTKYVDEYLFGGENTASVPYAVQRTDGEITTVTYQGSQADRTVKVAPAVDSYISFTGQSIFGADERQPPVFYGTTGASAGTGTSSVRGEVWLTVTHDGTNYRLSIDDGATETVVPTAGDLTNIAVTNADGQILYVNASAVTQTGTEKVRIPGTEDVFSILINMRDLLRNPHNLSTTALADLTELAAGSLENIKNRMIEKEASIGTRINFLDKLKESLDNIRFNENEEATSLQQADIAQVMIDISRRETLYQMSLSVSGKLMSMSLLDFIR